MGRFKRDTVKEYPVFAMNPRVFISHSSQTFFHSVKFRYFQSTLVHIAKLLHSPFLYYNILTFQHPFALKMEKPQQKSVNFDKIFIRQYSRALGEFIQVPAPSNESSLYFRQFSIVLHCDVTLFYSFSHPAPRRQSISVFWTSTWPGLGL